MTTHADAEAEDAATGWAVVRQYAASQADPTMMYQALHRYTRRGTCTTTVWHGRISRPVPSRASELAPQKPWSTPPSTGKPTPVM